MYYGLQRLNAPHDAGRKICVGINTPHHTVSTMSSIAKLSGGRRSPRKSPKRKAAPHLAKWRSASKAAAVKMGLSPALAKQMVVMPRKGSKLHRLAKKKMGEKAKKSPKRMSGGRKHSPKRRRKSPKRSSKRSPKRRRKSPGRRRRR